MTSLGFNPAPEGIPKGDLLDRSVNPDAIFVELITIIIIAKPLEGRHLYRNPVTSKEESPGRGGIQLQQLAHASDTSFYTQKVPIKTAFDLDEAEHYLFVKKSLMKELL